MDIWGLFFLQPVTNVLIVLSHYLADSLGLAIIALTLVVNLLILPLTIKQIRSQKQLQDLQPRMAELQKKYARDKQKLGEEQMKMYKEAGISPTGCLLPMLVQMPVWFAVYQAVMLCLAVAPEGLLKLSSFLYSWPMLRTLVPLQNDFLWLNLALPDIVLAVLVGVTMWLQQKMTTAPSTDPRQQQQAQTMLWMMPLMFTVLAMTFPSGLSLFWVISSVARIALQCYVTGWGPLATLLPARLFTGGQGKSQADSADIVIKDEPEAKSTKSSAPGTGRPGYQPDKTRVRRPRKK